MKKEIICTVCPMGCRITVEGEGENIVSVTGYTCKRGEVYASAGSACASNKPAVSATLKAINAPKEHLDSTLRFSFSVHTTKEEIDYCIEVLKGLLPMLRRYARH